MLACLGSSFFVNILINKSVNKSALEKMLLNYFRNIAFLNAAVKSAFGIDDDNGAESAKAEAARLDYFNLILKTLLCKLFFKGGHKHLAAR